MLARLAGALRDEHSRDRRDTLSRKAVELARRTENPAALVYALDGRCASIISPDTVAERLALGSELRDVAERIGDTERLLQAHLHRVIAQLEAGDVPGAEADLDAASHIAHDLRMPAQRWQIGGVEAMLALAAGRLDEAEKLVQQAFALGEHTQPTAAIPVYWLQRYALGDFRGSLEEVEPAIRDLVVEYPARPVFRCALAHLYVKVGRLPEARRVFVNLARNSFSTLPFDIEWLYGMSMLAETCSALNDEASAAVLYRLFLPWATFNVADIAEGMRGSVSRYLGILATTKGHWRSAAEHFEDALEMNERMGTRPWLARTQHDYGRMLLARDAPGDKEKAQLLLSQALMTYRELGMQTGTASAPTLTLDAGAPSP